jgi:uncharacterized membrane protein YbhN (UPF0104 family)
MVLLILIGWRMDWHQVGAAFARASWPVWVGALALYLAIQVISSLRWQLLSRPLGLGGNLAAYTRDYFVGMFFNLVLPTSVGGDVVRVVALAGREGTTLASGRHLAAALSVLADRVNGVLVLVALASAATLACPVALPVWMLWCVAALGVGATLGVAALPFLNRLLGACCKVDPAAHAPGSPVVNPGGDAPSSPWFERARQFLDAVAILVRHPGALAAATGLSVLVQAGNVVVIWMIGADIGLHVPPLYYAVWVPLISLLTLLPISLNGMGLREGGTVLLLAPLGVGAGEALTLSLLSFTVVTAAGACGGLWWFLSGRNAKPEENSDEVTEQALAA